MSCDDFGLVNGHRRQNPRRGTVPLVGWSLTHFGLCGLGLLGRYSLGLLEEDPAEELRTSWSGHRLEEWQLGTESR